MSSTSATTTFGRASARASGAARTLPGATKATTPAAATSGARRIYRERLAAIRASDRILSSPSYGRRVSLLLELDRLRREHGLDIPPPRHVVFGHTHQPIAWGSGELTDTIDGRPMDFCNTGGWLLRQVPGGAEEYPGAEVVVYETGCGVRSVPVTAADLARPDPSAP